MSIASDCPSCGMGNHDQHDPKHGLREGLIGGTYCGCPGDCRERFQAEGERFTAIWRTARTHRADPSRDTEGEST